MSVRYQHVRNVLSQEIAQKKPETSNDDSLPSASSTSAGATMDQIVGGLSTKSSKIRVLARAGYSCSEIAKYLGIRYQFAYNVLAQKKSERTPDQVLVSVGPGGRIVIPIAYRQLLAIEDGDELLLRLEGDELRIASRAAGIRRAQEIVARYVPKSVNLVDELMAERRREAEIESRGG
jgi:bifunctional DNA-binding transcriptional regulator/antitoxin component of YhaV-PrlF toxin-antitoxin module